MASQSMGYRHYRLRAAPLQCTAGRGTIRIHGPGRAGPGRAWAAVPQHGKRDSVAVTRVADESFLSFMRGGQLSLTDRAARSLQGRVGFADRPRKVFRRIKLSGCASVVRVC